MRSHLSSIPPGARLVAQLSGFFLGEGGGEGVIIYEEPLLGLAMDQVERATTIDHIVKGHHGNEHKHKDQRLLIKCLLSFKSDCKEANRMVIKLLVEPKLITSNT